MNSFAKVLALGAVLAASAPLALADPITGTATVFGFDTFNPTSITFTPMTGTLVGTGTLAALSGPVNLQSFTFANSNGTSLFSTPAGTEGFLIAGPTTVVSIIDETFLNVKGNGTFYENGYTPTQGTFTLTSTQNGAISFTIDAVPNAVAVTPEPSSLVLLGTGLIGAAGMLFRRRQTV